jgi:hypothetical protein
MTILGQVTSTSGAPLQGVSVGIAALNVSARTSAEGRYAVMIRPSDVRGQAVTMTARHARLGSQSVRIDLVGGSIEQDFVLVEQTREGVRLAESATSTSGTRRPALQTRERVLADATLAETAGPTDIASALAGRDAPLLVTSANTAGGSAALLYRGTRSLFARNQPLVVVDGIVVDNESFTTLAQAFGKGGYDYGSPVSDMALDDVERIVLLDPVAATLRYGPRAANGVIEIRSRSGVGVTGSTLTVAQRFTGQSAAILPEYQNRFGQGLGGQYEFFDGQGGGVNDAVAENWGPLLDSRAIVQHSLTEPGRPDVRYWSPQPADIGSYFGGASSYDASVAFLGSRESAHLRAAFNGRILTGLTPGHSAQRRGASLSGGARLAPGLTTRVNAQFVSSSAEHRPGTGFDVVNPVSEFIRMGRQVDLDALRTSVSDASGGQINWIYTNHNNPFFSTTLNSNADDRRHVIGGLGLSYDVTSWMRASVDGGTDDWHATRNVRVADGWRGGFPTALGRAGFAAGGIEQHALTASERMARMSLDLGSPRAIAGGFAWTASLGADLRSSEFASHVTVTNLESADESTVQNAEERGQHDAGGLLASVAATRSDLMLSAGVRVDRSSSPSTSHTTVYPAAQFTYDAAGFMNGTGVREAKLFARFWRAGNEITSRSLAMLSIPATVSSPDLALDQPEQTSGLELGTAIASSGRRVAIDFTAYRERSTDLLILGSTDAGGTSVSQGGEIFNGGIEAGLRARVLGAGGIGDSDERAWWDVHASFARNSSTVDRLGTAEAGDESSVTVSPDLFGVCVGAQVGRAAGLILGTRLLRNDAGQLVLRDGLPLADDSAPLAVLGSVQPDWTASLRSEMRFRSIELSVLMDARIGGKIFSATNRWGSQAGTLASTLIGDRAPGAASGDSLTIAGVDSATGLASATKVSAEQYFHALAGIAEPWVYDASYVKLREVRMTYSLPTRFLPGFREHALRVSLVGRNLLTQAAAPNIDPETTLSTRGVFGFEMGQLPSWRSVGIHVTVTP